MTASQRNNRVPYVATLVVAVVMFVAGLGRFGVWQPAEVRIAELARGEQTPAAENNGTRNNTVGRPPAQIALVRMGFQRIGPTEAGGRMPTALLALFAAMALAFAVGSATDPRTGGFVGIAYATMPLAFMNARQMFGGGVAQSGFTLLFASLIYSIWGRPPEGVDELAPEGNGAIWARARWLLWLTAFFAASAAGWMLGVVPVVLGVGLAVAIRWQDEPQYRRIAGAILVGLGAVLALVAIGTAIAPAEGSGTAPSGFPKLALSIARSLFGLTNDYNPLTGTGAEHRAPGALPTYEAFIEHIGHGIFPWTGFAAFGILRLLVPPPHGVQPIGDTGERVEEKDAWRESGLRLAAFGSLVLAYGFQSFHFQQYGMSPFIAAAPLAVGIGVALRDAEREAAPGRIVTAGATFFTLLMLRDYMLFPKSSYAALGLADGGPGFPSGFTGTLKDWVRAQGSGAPMAILRSNAPGEVYFLLEALLFIFTALAALFQGSGTIRSFPLNRPFKWLEDVERMAKTAMDAEKENSSIGRWPRQLTGFGILASIRTWLAGFAIVLIFGASAAATTLNVITPVRTAFKVIAALPFVVVGGTYAVLLLWNLFAWIGAPGGPLGSLLGSRIAIIPAGATLVSFIIAQLFVPALSEHLSPRGVWAVIRSVRQSGEPVARFGGNQNDRATRYYADFETTDLSSEAEAVQWLLRRSPRHFMIAASDVFPSLNRAFRAAQPQGQRRNIPVIDATNSNLYVAASDPGERGSRNPLDAVVMTQDTLLGRNDHWHAHGRWENGRVQPEPARFDDAIEYVGYNLDSNGMSYVPVGGSFKIKYHFRVLRDIHSNHQIFVHVDGACPRINGDHEPAGGRYPIRYWLAGDTIHDEQQLTIPGYCRAGTYTVFIGFYQGEDRMRVTGGDHDRENRVVAARIVVR